MSDKKQTVDLGLLEEDDEFEEFPAEGEQDWRWSEVVSAACVVSLCVADRKCRGFFLFLPGPATVTQLALALALAVAHWFVVTTMSSLVLPH